ncbi:hypothetical protein [Vibrio splendidus]|uniref:hypothetical protein n=1 Tax=Vibrio splendidus TaxID=29497 RepID=UPI000D3D489D|nr:hypothetical protein [Vibrio splendidus]PTP81959.1 hypothetical protein CWO03_22340 [Vibrio splendidus]
MLLPPLPTGNSRNKIEFLYEHMNSGEPSSDAPLPIPIIQGIFPSNNDNSWNTDLDGFFLKYDQPSYLEDGDMDIMPLLRPELDNDKPLLKVFFNISTLAQLSSLHGELCFTVVLADEQGNVMKDPDGYLIKWELKSTTIHGQASELGQRVTANETSVFLIDKELIQGKQKVFPHLLIQADGAYSSSNGKTNQEVVGDLFLHYGDITIVSLGVSSTDLTPLPYDSGSPTPN